MKIQELFFLFIWFFLSKSTQIKSAQNKIELVLKHISRLNNFHVDFFPKTN